MILMLHVASRTDWLSRCSIQGLISGGVRVGKGPGIRHVCVCVCVSVCVCVWGRGGVLVTNQYPHPWYSCRVHEHARHTMEKAHRQ